MNCQPSSLWQDKGQNDSISYSRTLHTSLPSLADPLIPAPTNPASLKTGACVYETCQEAERRGKKRLRRSSHPLSPLPPFKDKTNHNNNTLKWNGSEQQEQRSRKWQQRDQVKTYSSVVQGERRAHMQIEKGCLVAVALRFSDAGFNR